MTCTGCQSKVQKLLSGVDGVKSVAIDLPKGEAAVEMNTHIATATLQAALKDYPKYQLSEAHHTMPSATAEITETTSWLSTYTPILLIFGYITGITLLVELVQGGFDGMRWMNHFMAGFFLELFFRQRLRSHAGNSIFRMGRRKLAKSSVEQTGLYQRSGTLG